MFKMSPSQVGRVETTLKRSRCVQIFLQTPSRFLASRTPLSLSRECRMGGGEMMSSDVERRHDM